MTRCPNCGRRIVPAANEMRRWRLDAGLSQREMAKKLRICAAYATYLESGQRHRSASAIARYWKFIPQ
jgi:transcriptional regulator with XRE-family HTH domain